MTEQSLQGSHGASDRFACGGTALVAVVFLAVAIGTLAQGNGLFSAGIGVMLLCYAGVLAFLARAAWLGQRWALGGLVASSLLHVLVSVSTARGSHQGWLHAFTLLATVTLVASLKLHLDDLRSTHDEP